MRPEASQNRAESRRNRRGGGDAPKRLDARRGAAEAKSGAFPAGRLPRRAKNHAQALPDVLESSSSFVQWEVERPHKGFIRENPTFATPRQLSTVSRSMFNQFAGRGFCEWKLNTMRNMNDGAVCAPYEAEADAPAAGGPFWPESEDLEALKADGLRLATFFYAVVVGRDEAGPYYMTADGNATQCLQGAANFDAWADAARFMLDNAIFAGDPPPIRRGYERPAFPRVCYVRTYEEVTVC